MKGSLPWQNAPGKNRNQKEKAISKIKLETPLEEVCKGAPEEFFEYMTYCRNLKFFQEPDYKHLITLFEKCMGRHKLDMKVGHDYIWKQNTVKKDKEALKQSMLDVIKRKPKVSDVYGNLPKDLFVRPVLSYNTGGGVPAFGAMGKIGSPQRNGGGSHADNVLGRNNRNESKNRKDL